MGEAVIITMAYFAGFGHTVGGVPSTETASAIIDRLGLCNCGHAQCWEIVKLMLERAEALDADRENAPSFYDAMDDIPARMVEFVAHVMGSDQWDLLEHGSSIGGAWLTKDGETLLAFLREHGTDQEEWPDA